MGEYIVASGMLQYFFFFGWTHYSLVQYCEGRWVRYLTIRKEGSVIKIKKKKIKRKKQDTESSELDIGNDSRVDEYLCRDAVRESFCECSEHVFLTSCAETTNQSGQIIAVVFGVVLLGKRTYKKQQQTLTSAFSRRYI